MIARRSAAGLVAVLLAAGCSSATDNSQISSGAGEPVATTPALAIPPVLRQPESSVADAMPDTLATTSPLTVPTEAPTTEAPIPAPTTEVAAPTAAPTAAATAAARTAAPTAAAPTGPATAASEVAAPTATAGPVATAAPVETTAAAAVNPTNAITISLGDFEVVNLVTGANQNIGELSPSGATMLWFWAPH